MKQKENKLVKKIEAIEKTLDKKIEFQKVQNTMNI